MNANIVADLLGKCATEQRGHVGIESSGPPSREKVKAKKRAAELVAQLAKPGQVALEIGAETNYTHLFEKVGVTVELLNLPADMHDLDAVAKYDGAIAMHVLEHSPFPLYVLAVLHRAVKDGGWFYVAVPHVNKRWARDPAHFSVLHPDTWARLLTHAGWTVVHRESGKLGPKPEKVEERFLCSRA